MKKVYEVLLAATVLSLLSLFCACSNSYDKMVEEYNKKYFAIEPTAPNNPDISDNTFLPDNMLEKRYTFIKGYESRLAAPSGGASYDWTVKLPDVNDPEVIVEKSVCSEQIYNFFPERVFKTDTEATLVLTVTDSTGAEYIDTALIIVISRN